jgi:CRP/FNR family transcriptional regulator, cyclic AMP receptor protein
MTSSAPEAGSPAGNPAAGLVDLAHCELFRDLAADRIADLERQCRCARFAAGDIILAAEDNRAHNVFVVLQGRAEVLRTGPSGAFVTLATLHPGMYFGEFSAIDGRSGSATIRAGSDATLAEIPREVFRLLLRDEPALAWRMMERLVHLIRSLDSRVAGLQGCQEEIDRIHCELFLVNL